MAAAVTRRAGGLSAAARRCCPAAPRRCQWAFAAPGSPGCATAAAAPNHAREFGTTTSPQPQGEIFANVNTNLKYMKFYGFDYDYTLAAYKPAIKPLIYELAKQELLKKGYPAQLATREYDPNFPIRGLHYDKLKGLLLKLDTFRNIQTPSREEEYEAGRAKTSTTQGCVYRGRRPLTTSQVLYEYKKLQLSEGYVNRNLHHLYDLFSLPEACLIADTIELMRHELQLEIDPGLVGADVMAAVGSIHISGLLHRAIAADISTYLDPDPNIAALMHRIRRHGKRPFLLTNSGFEFVDAGMRQLTSQTAFEEGEEGMKDWRSLFDFIGVHSGKPGFFKETSRPFRQLDLPPADELPAHTAAWSRGEAMPRPALWERVTKLQAGRTAVYTGGCVTHFHRLGWADSPGKVLYVGDHLASDLLVPATRHGWRTLMVLAELEEETDVLQSPEYQTALANLVAAEDGIRQGQLVSEEAWAEPGEGGRRAEVQALEGELGRLKEERDGWRAELKSMVNPHFGSCFRSFINPSFFAGSFLQTVDIYTGTVGNLLNYPMQYCFYPERRQLPHEAPVKRDT